jgi:hypothetical protein
MTAHVLVYVFLAIALGFMVYVIGTPWLTPKASPSRRKPHRHSEFSGRGRKFHRD